MIKQKINFTLEERRLLKWFIIAGFAGGSLAALVPPALLVNKAYKDLMNISKPLIWVFYDREKNCLDPRIFDALDNCFGINKPGSELQTTEKLRFALNKLKLQSKSYSEAEKLFIEFNKTFVVEHTFKPLAKKSIPISLLTGLAGAYLASKYGKKRILKNRDYRVFLQQRNKRKIQKKLGKK